MESDFTAESMQSWHLPLLATEIRHPSKTLTSMSASSPGGAAASYVQWFLSSADAHNLEQHVPAMAPGSLDVAVQSLSCH